MLCECVLIAWNKISNETAYTYSKNAVSQTAYSKGHTMANCAR